MKKYLIAVTAIAMAVGLTSCLKYEDGPIVSIKSAESRIANVWKVDSATNADGEDVSGNYDTWKFELTEEGTAVVSFGTIVGTATLTGTWALEDDKANLQITAQDATGLLKYDEKYIIVRLTEDEVWLRDFQNDKEGFHFTPF